MKRIHIFVSGLVQGVFFRSHTRQWARELGLTGWVRNTSDGRVEIVAEGSEEKLKKLIELVEKGPSYAEVEKIEVEWLKAEKEFDSFQVSY